MTMPSKPVLGAGRKIGVTAPSAAQAAKTATQPAREPAAFTPPKAPAKPVAATFLSPSLGGAAAQPSGTHPLLLGRYSAQAPVGETAEMAYKLTGTSPTVAKNAYPFGELVPGQTVYLVADPYGETVKTSKVSMPDDDLSGHPDPTAISVQDAPVGGRHIGYVPKDRAAALSMVFGEYPATQVWPVVDSLNIDRDGVARGVNVVIHFQEAA
jgi:hypothetical protein